MVRVARRVFVLAALAVLSACGPSWQDEVLDLAVDDLHCARGDIAVRYAGPLAFDPLGQTGDPTMPSSSFEAVAHGCAASAAYACTPMESNGSTHYSCCNMASRGCY